MHYEIHESCVVSGLPIVQTLLRTREFDHRLRYRRCSRCWPEDPGIRQWPVYIHIRKRRAIWISASVVAHHREITPLYLIDNGNRLRGRKWLRLPREDGSTMVFALWLFNLPQRSISSLLCLSCISYICSSLAYLYLSYFSFNLIYLLFFYYLIYSLFIILKT